MANIFDDTLHRQARSRGLTEGGQRTLCGLTERGVGHHAWNCYA